MTKELKNVLDTIMRPGFGETPEPGAIIFWYKNWRGEEGYRRVRPISMRWGSSEWHKEPQWLMLGYDTENNKQREFAMRDMSGMVGSPLIELGHAHGQTTPR